MPLQIAIVRALGWQPTAESLGYLQQALSFTPPPVRLEIVRVMGRLSTPDLAALAAASLQSLLVPALDSDPDLKQAVALSLGELGEPQSIPVLIQLLADPDLGVRLHAIAALKKLDAETARAQLQVLSQRDDLSPDLRQGIAVALQEWQH
jgi:HEAT repeat protein